MKPLTESVFPKLHSDSAAWLYIAEQVEAHGIKHRLCRGDSWGCVPLGDVRGLCLAVRHLREGEQISCGRTARMWQQIEALGRDIEYTGRSYDSGYFWPRNRKGWEHRVIAATFLSELYKRSRT